MPCDTSVQGQEEGLGGTAAAPGRVYPTNVRVVAIPNGSARVQLPLSLRTHVAQRRSQDGPAGGGPPVQGPERDTSFNPSLRQERPPHGVNPVPHHVSMSLNSRQSQSFLSTFSFLAIVFGWLWVF